MIPEDASASTAGSPSEEQVLDALRGVIDPEVGVNIVDLGLIYETKISEGHVHVTMTMTTATCPLHAYISDMAKSAIAALPGVGSVETEMVWDPPWTADLMSDAARRQLGYK